MLQSGAHKEGEYIKYEDLSEKELEDGIFSQCHFMKCNFTSTDMSGSEFTDCIFEQCNLSLTKMINTELKNVTFKNSKLLGLDLTRCSINFFDLSFEGCLIENVNFSDIPMKQTPFIDCDIRESYFKNTNLTRATFKNCNLEKSVFHESELSGADFTTATNYSINPLTNKTKGAKFSLPEAVTLLNAFDIKIV